MSYALTMPPAALTEVVASIGPTSAAPTSTCRGNMDLRRCLLFAARSDRAHPACHPQDASRVRDRHRRRGSRRPRCVDRARPMALSGDRRTARRDPGRCICGHRARTAPTSEHGRTRIAMISSRIRTSPSWAHSSSTSPTRSWPRSRTGPGPTWKRERRAWSRVSLGRARGRSVRPARGGAVRRGGNVSRNCRVVGGGRVGHGRRRGPQRPPTKGT